MYESAVLTHQLADCLHYNVQEARLLVGNVYRQTEKLLLESKEKLRIVSTNGKNSYSLHVF